MVTRWPRRRRMLAQRSAATALPVRVLGPGGVIRIIFMDHAASERPSSGASPAELASQLNETRTRTLWLTDGLSSEQLMGLKLDIVNPVLWEIGHVGWFHEYWTLRHSHGQAPLIDRADDLWNSSTVAHDTRWSLDLPDRNATFAYLREVLERQCGQLARADFPDRALYFYDLAIRHEDMHVEALTYMRETLAYPPPRDLGDQAATDAGGLPGDAEVPGGTWRLGATRREGFIFDNEKWAHEVKLSPFRIARAPVTNRDFAAFVEAGCFRQLARGRGVVPLGRATAADRGGMGGSSDRRAERSWRPALQHQAALAVGRRRTDAPACEFGFCIRRSARRCRLSARRQRLRLPADGRQRLGMDGFRLCAVSRVQRRSL